MGRAVLLWMIPINLFLVLWIWFGRLVFGVGGWFFLIFLLSVVPVVFGALLTTTILAYTQDGRPRSLTGFQAGAQLATWLALLVFGTFCPDFGDTEESEMSVLTQVFGWSRTALDISYAITLAAALGAVVAWSVLLWSLVFARREAPATMGS